MPQDTVPMLNKNFFSFKIKEYVCSAIFRLMPF